MLTKNRTNFDSSSSRTIGVDHVRRHPSSENAREERATSNVKDEVGEIPWTCRQTRRDRNSRGADHEPARPDGTNQNDSATEEEEEEAD